MGAKQRYKAPTVDPSPEEIEAACLAIQAKWSERERHKRAGLDYQLWTAPEVDGRGYAPPYFDP